MQSIRDGSQNWEPAKGRTTSVLNIAKVKCLGVLHRLGRLPKEDLLIGGMFATVIIITIWLAARLL
jgi:hypothetical protein